MSHFTVLVVLRNATDAAEAESQLDDALEPFNENTEVTPHVEWQDDESVGRAVSFFRDHPECCGEGEGPAKPFDEFVGDGNLEAWHEWTRQAVGGYCTSDPNQGIYDPEGDRYGYMSTYNPDSKWDWWTLGGRWHGTFHLKPKTVAGSRTHGFKAIGDSALGELQVKPFDGSQDAILGPGGVGGDDPGENFAGRADLVRKGDIDIDGMRTLAGQQAEMTFDKLEAATKDLDLPLSFLEIREQTLAEQGVDPDADFSQWRPQEEVEVRRKTWPHNIAMDIARERYRDQPFIKALREAELVGWFSEPVEDFCLRDENPRAAYVEQQRLRALSAYAMLIDGEWIGKGDMGWFGMSDDKMSERDWLRQINTTIEALPDDAYLAVVDCHI